MKWKSIVELVAIVLTALIVFHFATKTKMFHIGEGAKKGDAPTSSVTAEAADPSVSVNYLNYNQTAGQNDIVVPGGSSSNAEVLSSQYALEEVVADQSYGAWSNYVSALG